MKPIPQDAHATATESNRFMTTVLDLDAKEDLDGLLQFVQTHAHDPDEMIATTHQLLVQMRFRSAYVLGMLFANMGHHHPIMSLARSVGALVFNNLAEEESGLQALRGQILTLGAEQQAIIAEMMIPLITHLLSTALGPPDAASLTIDSDRVLRILKICRAALPDLWNQFDPDAVAPPFSLDAQRQSGRAKSRLLDNPERSVDPSQPPRRVVVAIREQVIPFDANSRLFDIGPRLLVAMGEYGWQTTSHAMKCVNIVDEYLAIAECCQRVNADLLIIDYDIMALYDRYQPGSEPARSEMIRQIRLAKPTIQIVACLFDVWAFKPEILRRAASLVDLFWTADSPSIPLWQEPIFANKVLQLFLPTGHVGSTTKPLLPEFYFSGSVLAMNWHRMFWLVLAEQRGVAITKAINAHHTDRLSAVESYAHYSRNLQDATCCVNFSMRQNQVRVITGKTYEVMLNGSLLVQERAAELDHFFVAGEHYLEFTTLADLVALQQFIIDHPEEAEAVRRRGHAFACAHYRDEKLLDKLNGRLVALTQNSAKLPDEPAKSLSPLACEPKGATLQWDSLPTMVNMGSGKNWRVDCLNVDCNAIWKPDLILDFNQPIPFGSMVPCERFGMIHLAENQMEMLIAIDVLEHIKQLTVVMFSALKWLKPGGLFLIDVPYDLSLGAWQDPTHVRAFNENSWLYYTDWFWYLGWNEARFELIENQFVLSEYGQTLQSQGQTLDDLLRQPRAVDTMKIRLRKRLLTPEEMALVYKIQQGDGVQGSGS